MKTTGKKITLIASALIVALVLSSCKKKEAKVGEEEPEAIFAVTTYKTKAGNLDDYLEFGGDVASRNSVAVLPDMAGKISQILVNVGQMVSKNQTIAYVDASMPGMHYSASPVRAPIAGRVTAIMPKVGSMVSQGTMVANIARTDELEIKISVPERFVSRVTDGQQAVITFDAYPGEEFIARVFEVSPVLDTTSRTMSVKLQLVKPDNRVKVGMYARVKLVTESKKDAIVVPSTAVITRSDKPYLFVIGSRGGDGKGKVRLVAVMPGISVDNKTEITQGIIAGDEVVIKGQNLLDDGASVNIVSTRED